MLTSVTLNTVRFYTDSDPYGTEVDNRPLKDIEANTQKLSSAVNELIQASSTKVIGFGQGLASANGAVYNQSLLSTSLPATAPGPITMGLLTTAGLLNTDLIVTAHVVSDVGTGNVSMRIVYLPISDGSVFRTSGTSDASGILAQFKVLGAEQVPVTSAKVKKNVFVSKIPLADLTGADAVLIGVQRLVNTAGFPASDGFTNSVQVLGLSAVQSK